MSENEDNRDADVWRASKYGNRKRSSLEINRDNEVEGDEGIPEKQEREMNSDRDMNRDREANRDREGNRDREANRDREVEPEGEVDVDGEREMESDGREEQVNQPRTPENLSLQDAVEKALVEYEIPDRDGRVTIRYYELDQKVGEEFVTEENIWTVDGYTAASTSEKFCLGHFGNVNRTEAVRERRELIREGVMFFKGGTIGGDEDGVYCECMSESPIFVQSVSLNIRYGLHIDSVLEVSRGNGRRKIYNKSEFPPLLRAAIEQTYNDVHALSRWNTVRISFGEKWGDDSEESENSEESEKNEESEETNEEKNAEVTDTSCWIEVDFRRPLEWMDRILRIKRSPSSCTSFS